jgi:hypothetical protein
MLPGRVRNPRPSVKALDQGFGREPFAWALWGAPTLCLREEQTGVAGSSFGPAMCPPSDIDMKSTDADNFGLLLERTTGASDVGVPAQR